jgi:hypothetical protein
VFLAVTGAAAAGLGLTDAAKATRAAVPRDLRTWPGVRREFRPAHTSKAFGGPGTAFRHGRVHEVGERQQCLLWLLALVMWIDGYGWDWAYEVAWANQP